MEQSDRDLIGLWRSGQSTGARQLVHRYYPRMLGLCYRLTGTRDASEELCQELFARLTRQVAAGRPIDNLEAWLHRTALNLWRDRARREILAREKGITPSGGDEVLARCPTAGGVEESVMGGWLRDAVRQAILCLSPPHREVLVLHHYQGLTYLQIADLTGAPIGTVRSRMFHAIRQLREHLGPAAEGGVEPWLNRES